MPEVMLSGYLFEVTDESWLLNKKFVTFSQHCGNYFIVLRTSVEWFVVRFPLYIHSPYLTKVVFKEILLKKTI